MVGELSVIAAAAAAQRWEHLTVTERSELCPFLALGSRTHNSWGSVTYYANPKSRSTVKK